MPGPLEPYSISPLTTELYPLDPFGNLGEATSLEAVTEGKYGIYAQGNTWQIYEVANPFNRFTLGQQGDARILIQPGDFIQATYGTLAGQAQAQIRGGAQTSLSGPVDVFLPSGDQFTVNVDSAIISGLDTSYFSHVLSTGEVEVIAVKGGMSLQEAISQTGIADLYPSTLGELADRAIMSDLTRNHSDQVKEVADKEFGGPGKSAGDAYYEALVYLASTANLQTFQFASTKLLGL